MEIVIKETGEIKEILLIDSKTGCDWLNDLVGNHDGFDNDPEKGFAKEYDEDGYFTGRFVTTLANFYWWDSVVVGIDEVNRRIDLLKDEFGTDRVDEVVYEANYGNTDLEYYASTLNQYLDFEFGEESGRE